MWTLSANYLLTYGLFKDAVNNSEYTAEIHTYCPGN
jgi:hypothetical protein